MRGKKRGGRDEKENDGKRTEERRLRKKGSEKEFGLRHGFFVRLTVCEILIGVHFD